MDSNAATDSLKLTPMLEEFRPFWPHMRAVLSLVASKSECSVIDYGCGPGAWSQCASGIFDSVTAIDVQQHKLDELDRLLRLNGTTNVKIINSLNAPISEVPMHDAMFAIDVTPVMRCVHIIEMFDFAARVLGRGGLFLCTSRRPGALLHMIATLDRFRIDGAFGGARRYLALGRSAIEALIHRSIDDIPRARFFLHADALIRLARSRGFDVVRAPADLAGQDAVIEMEPAYSGGPVAPQKPRYQDWYLFEKTGITG